jgi:hypothetical protein
MEVGIASQKGRGWLYSLIGTEYNQPRPFFYHLEKLRVHASFLVLHDGQCTLAGTSKKHRSLFLISRSKLQFGCMK